MPSQIHPTIAPRDHKAFMEYALQVASQSPPGPDKFCVGACLVDEDSGRILSTGYSLELPGDRPGDPGRTHAEQCCFIKISEQFNTAEVQIGNVLPPNTVLYTTMEPCNSRLTGNKSCVDRIIGLDGAIKAVYVGIQEPNTFIFANSGRDRLEKAGIRMVFLEGLQDRILEVAMAGHKNR
ncbi:cytidine deaminase-like protein [Annulohypoxylon truncatum]|uniref:cytidine deaminase-like protein n=1 Tax=Annulohypoxylon truncatum TaxID=327061 RepID=UPI0020083FC9|nr:cytidine deaminase-like protein [Annulohypoxylon truncatum]KAI1205260.1 cytidine deaminase-like protein [Annulohypoxylon truncatum]